MLSVIILTLALATFNPFDSNVPPAFYLPCLLSMPKEASLIICFADRQTGFLMECTNTGSVGLGTVRKEWFEYVLIHISLFIVSLFTVHRFFVVCIRSSKSAVFIISLSVMFYTIDDILLLQEGIQLPFFDAGWFGSVAWRIGVFYGKF